MKSSLRRTLGTVTAVLVLILTALPVLGGDIPPGGTFIDDDGSIHEADIEAIAAEGITKGCNPPTNNLFCPDDFVTRAQMAAFLHRALDDILTPGDPVEFIDDNDSIFEADIEWLGATGVTKSCNPPTNNLFCPDDFVTRAQMASFLTRALGLEPIEPPPPTTSTTTGDTTTTTDGTTTTTTVGAVTHDVDVDDNFYEPNPVEIDVGDTVEWTWVGDALHSVTSGDPGAPDGEFDSGIEDTGFVHSETFSEAGTFDYFCSVHGAVMTGTITVVDS